MLNFHQIDALIACEQAPYWGIEWNENLQEERAKNEIILTFKSLFADWVLHRLSG